MHFHDTDDSSFNRNLRRAAPEMYKSFIDFDAAVMSADSALSVKSKELIAIAVAATTQCPYCIDAHVTGAKQAGATEEEVAEAVMISAALRAGGSFTHGWLAMKAYAQDSPD